MKQLIITALLLLLCVSAKADFKITAIDGVPISPISNNIYFVDGFYKSYISGTCTYTANGTPSAINGNPNGILTSLTFPGIIWTGTCLPDGTFNSPISLSYINKSDGIVSVLFHTASIFDPTPPQTIRLKAVVNLSCYNSFSFGGNRQLRTINFHISPCYGDDGLTVNTYVLLEYQGKLLFIKDSGTTSNPNYSFVNYTGGDLPVFRVVQNFGNANYNASGAEITIKDLTSLVGANFYLGYGTSLDDMIQRHTYGYITTYKGEQ